MGDIVTIVEKQRSSVYSVGTTPVQLLYEKATSERITFVIVNTSTTNQKITLGFGENATAGSGIVLYPGQGWTEAIGESFLPSNARITAVADAAGGTVAVYERTR